MTSSAYHEIGSGRCDPDKKGIFLLTIVIALTIGVVTGCSSDPSHGQGFDDLAGTQWEMTSMIIDGTAYQGMPDFFDLNFTEDMASGRSDCNFWSGRYSLDRSGNFVLSSMGFTEIACQQSSIEEPYFDALARLNRHSADGENLVLTSSEGDRITFARKD